VRWVQLIKGLPRSQHTGTNAWVLMQGVYDPEVHRECMTSDGEDEDSDGSIPSEAQMAAAGGFTSTAPPTKGKLPSAGGLGLFAPLCGGGGSGGSAAASGGGGGGGASSSASGFLPRAHKIKFSSVRHLVNVYAKSSESDTNISFDTMGVSSEFARMAGIPASASGTSLASLLPLLLDTRAPSYSTGQVPDLLRRNVYGVGRDMVAGAFTVSFPCSDEALNPFNGTEGAETEKQLVLKLALQDTVVMALSFARKQWGLEMATERQVSFHLRNLYLGALHAGASLAAGKSAGAISPGGATHAVDAVVCTQVTAMPWLEVDPTVPLMFAPPYVPYVGADDEPAVAAAAPRLPAVAAASGAAAAAAAAAAEGAGGEEGEEEEDEEAGFVRLSAAMKQALKRRRMLLAATVPRAAQPASQPSGGARPLRVTHLLIGLGNAFAKSGFAADVCAVLEDPLAPMLTKKGAYTLSSARPRPCAWKSYPPHPPLAHTFPVPFPPPAPTQQ
jgi:hypothetical protein